MGHIQAVIPRIQVVIPLIRGRLDAIRFASLSGVVWKVTLTFSIVRSLSPRHLYWHLEYGLLKKDFAIE